MYESSISNELREHPEYTADFLAAHEEKSLLRFITCGSVDDGKSTLIGRILFETNMIFDNEFATLQRDSQKFGTTGENIDFALLVDGLSSEREQGITIDVAYRFFATPQRKFIVADTPGHEQYTRNMATGASTADLAVVMIDSRKGVLTQTKRHSLIVSLLGVKQVVVAVNKMDLVGYDYQQFLEIERSYRQFAENLGFEQIDVIPVSALRGDNITAPSSGMPWYHGKTLLRTLECAKTKVNQRTDEFRFPVQWVNRPNPGFRGYAGTVASGNIKPGDAVRIQPSGKTTRVKQIVAYSGEQVMADTGESITLTLDDEIDVSRGDVITNIQSPCEVADQFQATILWMSDRPMVRGRQYLLKCATQNALCTPNAPKYQLDVNTGEHKAADQLELNQIGVCDIYLNKEIVFESYEKNKTLGGFILIDRLSNETVACGWLNFALRRSGNIHRQNFTVNKQTRIGIKGHHPCVLWFTGLSGAGKSTIANLVEAKLNQKKAHTILLDGDNIRHGLNKDLGFTERDRAENIRRIAEVAKLMCDAGLICIVSFISPFEHERLMAKELIGETDFFELFIDVPLAVAEMRDVKGLYKKARKGEIKNFTGIDSPYQPPSNPTLTIDTTEQSAEHASEMIINLLVEKEII
ncbi:TPA: sulfate adenylyltransferase subunit CysN [Legionella pneumophila]|uniref:sulfate adenylyltransferase subunit CysN n=1 Tax=Legionella pneumophila TaxID=446 RepID=UPI0005C432DA|nr:sulfate adenylyltransferase subunit CysN [Legionella pneumophila]HAT9434012.1 sulfate adenylyltransferase subunit CysN [Legionella pneumophila subsp. pneumophila]MCW8406531.1 sulfate adenylyltransferase subunit CysN [Legionella pneumophila]RYB35685.1 sulfate adenylyltransferase subunit CysN [Legionella pneumophila]RYB42958.1 sulfate adenylyltransferase subunit CysN [Legionella pneumophila]RYB71506.1 sulfate adenylyltransferase subunit CysN [Legionella pneumophila]